MYSIYNPSLPLFQGLKQKYWKKANFFVDSGAVRKCFYGVGEIINFRRSAVVTRFRPMMYQQEFGIVHNYEDPANNTG